MEQQDAGTSTQTSALTPPAPALQQQHDDASVIGDHHTNNDQDTDDELANLVYYVYFACNIKIHQNSNGFH